MIAERAGLIAGAVAVIVAGGAAYLWLGDRALVGLPYARYRKLVPWLFVGPAAVTVALLLAFPAALTFWWSLFDADGGRFVGLANYAQILSDQVTRIALRNTVLWVVLLPTLAVLVGLVAAVLAERVRYGVVSPSGLDQRFGRTRDRVDWDGCTVRVHESVKEIRTARD